MLAFEVAGRPRRRPGDHRRAAAPGADRVARQRPHDGRPPAVDLAPPVERGGAARGRDHARPAPGLGRARGPRGPRRPTSRPRSARALAALDGAARPGRSAPSRGRSHREPGRRLDGHEPDRPAGTSPPASGTGLWHLFTSVDFAVAPDHRPAAARGRRDDDQAAARLRVPLRDRLRGRDGRSSTPATTRSSGAAVVDVLERLSRLRDLPLAVVQRRAGRARHLDRRLHARPDAAAVARRRATSGSPSPSRSSTRGCRTGRRWTAWPADDVRAVLRAQRVPGPRGDRRGRHALPLRRPPPVHEDGDAAHPPRADPVPRRGGGHVAARRRAGPRRRRGRVADGPADRDARACCWSRTSTSRRPASTPASPTDFTTDLAVFQDGQRDRPQDDPGQRPAVGRRLHVPPERVRAGAAPRAQDAAGAIRCGTRPCR